MTIRDGITTAIAVLAFAISGVTAYFNLFRQADDVRVIIKGSPTVAVASDVSKLVLSGGSSLTFINSGNRPAALLGIIALVDQTGEREKPCENGSLFGTDFKPLVVKPGEIVTTEVRVSDLPLSSLARPGGRGEIVFSASDENKARSVYWIGVCFQFELATPSISSRPTQVYLLQYEMEKREGLSMREYASDERKKPIILLRERGTSFDR